MGSTVVRFLRHCSKTDLCAQSMNVTSFSLSTLITANRLRHTGGPVLSILTVTWMVQVKSPSGPLFLPLEYWTLNILYMEGIRILGVRYSDHNCIWKTVDSKSQLLTVKREIPQTHNVRCDAAYHSDLILVDPGLSSRSPWHKLFWFEPEADFSLCRFYSIRTVTYVASSL